MRVFPLSTALVAILILSNALASSSLAIGNSGLVTAGTGQWFDYVVVIMMENHSFDNTYGTSVAPNSWNSNSKTCLGNCTFFDSFANSNGLAEQYTDDSIAAGSIGDYIAITSGYGNTNPGCNSNPPGGSGCALLRISNIVDSLESADLSWKAYMEGYPQPSGCVNNDAGYPYYYHFDHNPFIYYADIQNSTTRCSHIVNANSINPQPNISEPRCWPIAVDNDDLFFNDLNSVVNAPHYMFLTPNTVDDAHDCNDISAGNAWLNRVVPQILGSALFTTRKAALFVTFDEPDCTYSMPTCPSSGPQLYTVWASNSANPTTNAGLKSVNTYTHYSALRTIEDNWKLPPLIPSTDGSANNMTEFLRARS